MSRIFSSAYRKLICSPQISYINMSHTLYLYHTFYIHRGLLWPTHSLPGRLLSVYLSTPFYLIAFFHADNCAHIAWLVTTRPGYHYSTLSLSHSFFTNDMVASWDGSPLLLGFSMDRYSYCWKVFRVQMQLYTKKGRVYNTGAILWLLNGLWYNWGVWSSFGPH